MAGSHSSRDRAKEQRAREKAELRELKGKAPTAREMRALDRAEQRRRSEFVSDVDGGQEEMPGRGDAWSSSLTGASTQTITRQGIARPGRSAYRTRSRVRGCLPWLAGFVVIVLIATYAGYVWVEHQVHGSATPGRSVVVTVPIGYNDSQIGDLLAHNGVITHPLVFHFYLKMHPAKPFEPGPYQFTKNEGYANIIKQLAAGPDQNLLAHKLTIPDGFTLAQVAQRVGTLPGHTAAGFTAAVTSGKIQSPFAPAGSTNLEGLLFPDTYEIGPHESDPEIIQQMSSDFVSYANKDNLTAGAKALGLTPYEVVIVASIVEKESNLPGDMGKVARVVYNRLKDKMPLQIDSTVIFALEQEGQTVTGPLTTAQTKVDNPYNTYENQGLPPGPISAPGQAALQAALNPTPGPWLYYVVTQQNGAESFATTLAEQNQNIALAKKNGLP